MADITDGQWRTLTEATSLLGISERTLRRQIATGRYQSQRVNGRALVLVATPAAVADSNGTMADTDEPLADMPATGGHVADTTLEAIAALERVLKAERERHREALQEMIAAREAAAMWQERARGLEAETQRLQAQLALPAPQPEPHAPWWAFWRRG